MSDPVEVAAEADMCVCGDSRRFHAGGTGPCMFDDDEGHWGHFGARRCLKFTPALRALADMAGGGT